MLLGGRASRTRHNRTKQDLNREHQPRAIPPLEPSSPAAFFRTYLCDSEKLPGPFIFISPGFFRCVNRSGEGRELRRKSRRPLERQGPEYVGFAIVGYLVQLREQPEEGFEVGISPYAIMRNVRQLNTQKQDRVEYILELLETNGLVHSKSAQRARYYEITDAGMEWYKKAAKAFYKPFLGLYKEPEF